MSAKSYAIPPQLPCFICRAPVVCDTKTSRAAMRRGRVYCSEKCSRAYCARRSAETMAATNRKYASARMTTNNPMRRPESVEKMRATLRRIGHKPCQRAGNGILTAPQKALAGALTAAGFDAVCEHAVNTSAVRDRFASASLSGKIAPCYKLDIAIPAARLGIEVDGGSHCSRRRQAEDALKTSVLNALGWTVLRFKNGQVVGDLESCVRQVKGAVADLAVVEGGRK